MNYKIANCFLNELHEQLLELAIKDVGKAHFAEDTFEQIDSQQQNDQEDFGFEEEDGQSPQQETQLFRKSIGLGPDNRPAIDQKLPQLRVQGYNFVFGANCGNRTVEFIKSSICRAVGVNLFYQNKIYFSHNQKITYLSFKNNKDILISGTEGKCAQIMLWRIKTQTGKNTLEPFLQKQNKLLNLPLSSLGVGFAWLFGDNSLAVITKFNLHQSSILYIFDINSGKRIRCDIKLEKVVQVCHNQQGNKVILLTESGLFSLVISLEMQVKLERIIQEELITQIQMLMMESGLYLLAGKLDGSVMLISQKAKKVVSTAKAHQKYVTCVRMIDKTSFLSLGRDQILNIYKISNENLEISHFQTLNIQQICVNALINKKHIYCISKGGKILEFAVQNSQKYIKVQQMIDQQMLYSLNPKAPLKQHWIFDKYSKKYIYSLSDSIEIAVLTISQNKQITAIKRYPLNYEPFLIDVVGNIAAYIYREVKASHKPSFETISSKFQTNEFSAQYLILQDYTTHQILTEMTMDLAGCTKVKLNGEGDKLAVGFQSGKIVIFDVNKPKAIVKVKQGSSHTKAIQNLIWSKDSKFIKSISKNNLLYFDMQKKGEEMTAVFGSKTIKDAEWPEVGKFDWRNSNIFQDHSHTIDEIRDIKSTQNYQLVVMENGKLKIFRNPAAKKGQELCRLFYTSYSLEVVQRKNRKLSILAMTEGIVFSAQIGQNCEDEDSDQKEQSNESFEQVEG